MKRDWEIIKQLIFKFRDDSIMNYLQQESDLITNYLQQETHCAFSADATKAREEIQKRQQIELEHIKLMQEDGLVSGIEVWTLAGVYDYQRKQSPRLTSLGQSFAEALEITKDGGFWNKVLKKAKEDVVPVSIELITKIMGLV